MNKTQKAQEFRGMNAGSIGRIQANNPNPITNLRFTDKGSPL